MPSRALMIIAPEVFRDEEYAVPREVLESAGIDVTVASATAGKCIGKLGMVAEADIALTEAPQVEWDAVVFVGGAGAKVFFDDPTAHEIARATLAGGGVVGAICIAPSVLAHAGLLNGVGATAFPSQEQDLIAHGAKWTGEPVSVSGRIVTANGPEAARQFGETLVDVLDGGGSGSA